MRKIEIDHRRQVVVTQDSEGEPPGKTASARICEKYWEARFGAAVETEVWVSLTRIKRVSRRLRCRDRTLWLVRDGRATTSAGSREVRSAGDSKAVIPAPRTSKQWCTSRSGRVWGASTCSGHLCPTNACWRGGSCVRVRLCGVGEYNRTQQLQRCDDPGCRGCACRRPFSKPINPQSSLNPAELLAKGTMSGRDAAGEMLANARLQLVQQFTEMTGTGVPRSQETAGIALGITLRPYDCLPTVVTMDYPRVRYSPNSCVAR